VTTFKRVISSANWCGRVGASRYAHKVDIEQLGSLHVLLERRL